MVCLASGGFARDVFRGRPKNVICLGLGVILFGVRILDIFASGSYQILFGIAISATSLHGNLLEWI